MQIPEKLLGIEANAEILNPRDSLLIHDRGEERVVDIPARRLPHEDPVPERDVLNLGPRAPQKGPAQ